MDSSESRPASNAGVAANDQGASWVGIPLAACNGFAALAALFIPKLAGVLGWRKAHLVCLWFGALGGLLLFLAILATLRVDDDEDGDW